MADEPRPLSQQPADASADLATRIEDLHAVEGAALLQTLPSKVSAGVSEYLDPKTAAQVLSRMEPAQAATVIAGMQAPEASMVLAAMHPDERVDILAHIPPAAHDVLLGEMTAGDAEETRQLEQYPPDTAGGLMTSDVTALSEDMTVQQAIDELRRLSRELEQMFYVYVVDRQKRLIGVLSMRDLILQPPTRRLNQIMRAGVKAVPASMDQEEVANLFRAYHYLAMPVVDAHNRLLGIVTADDVVGVAQEEATEDMQKFFGAGAEERLASPWRFSFNKRVWWLIVNLGTAFLAAAVVAAFEGIIQKLAILAAYMPIVAGMGGNASAQAMSVAIRGIAVGKVDRRLLRHVIFREFMVGVLTGVVIGLITAGVCLLFHQNAWLGLIVALALVVNHVLACVSGAAIPFMMKRLGFDPAQSATIFATTITDVAGFFALLGLAYIFMPKLIG